MSRPVVPLLLSALFVLMAASPVLGGPGAHGPNGEHLDAPAALQAQATTALVPRLEAVSEDFELVATLHHGELSIFIDRYETNEPVLQARVEVQAGNLTSTAHYRSGPGDYVVEDPTLRRALSQPGRHPVVFTLHTGATADLLEGVLEVPAEGAGHHEDGHGHGHDIVDAPRHTPDDAPSQGPWKALGIAAVMAGLAGLLAAAWRLGRRHAAARRPPSITPSPAGEERQGDPR